MQCFRRIAPQFCAGAKHFHKKAEEVTIPVPWGHIAGKLWGESEKLPILALHGWQDNASTFDYLIEHLKIDRPILAIDFPGHGFSSPWFPFFPYHEIDTILTVRFVQIFYGWDKLLLLGHSMGAKTSFLFSGIYPNAVSAMINLDCVKPAEQNSEERAAEMGSLMDRIIDLMKRDVSNAGYCKQELENHWLMSTNISQKSVKKLMERGSHEVKPGLFYFTSDERLKAGQMHRWECGDNMEIASNIECPVLLIKGNNSKYFDLSISGCPMILDEIKSSASSFQMETIDGSHHLQIDKPQEVADIIEKFLETVDDEY